MKIKEFFNNIIWSIKSFIRQPIIFNKTKEWIIKNNCSYTGSNKKYDFYWFGDFKTGYLIKNKKNKGRS